ncbi:MAG: glycine betaine ABC transporter substrate-binding protein [Gemmatimonadota bacterium]
MRPATPVGFAFAALLLVAGGCSSGGPARAERVVVGSKAFTENVVLGDIAAGAIEASGPAAEHRRELGGTRILWEALRGGDVDVYPEYTGTILEEILTGWPGLSASDLPGALAELGVGITAPLGFDNTYVLGVTRATAEARGLETISDLREHPDLVFGFSNEFMDRGDGWPALRREYGLDAENVRGIDHDLAYRALESGSIDVIDLYSTDAEIEYYDLVALVDDRDHFPDYRAVLLYRLDLGSRAPAAVEALESLEGTIGEEAMIDMNAAVKLAGEPSARVAMEFLRDRLGLESGLTVEATRWERIAGHTADHLVLVLISMALALATALPLGILAARHVGAGRLILGAVGAIYTIPALALLVFMIPLLGIGGGPAVVALWLYSLLPIVRNTHQGLTDIPRPLRESADALGLSEWAKLRRIELPLATPSIMAGIKTAVVINIGTATLGALIGAGGLGQPILTGIRLADTGLILEGAVPAALLALGAQALFDGLERRVVPRGLRL